MATPDDARPERTPEERRDDHAAIDRLAGELLPALIAKLGASGLGELDVHEGEWHVRLRMPADGRAARRSAPARAGARSEARPEGRAESSAPAAGSPAPAGAPGTDGPAAGVAAGAVALDPIPLDPSASNGAAPPTRAVATSPAVGFFRPRTDLAAGARVRAGDRIATIDVLGVGQEVVAPVDGLVGATLVDPGSPVEYGQKVVEIELLGEPAVERGEAG